MEYPRNAKKAEMIIRFFSHNSIAWDQPMGMIKVDLKEFVDKKTPRQEMNRPLESSGPKDTKVTGDIYFELINEDKQAQDMKTPTQKIIHQSDFDEDFMSLNHRLAVDILCNNIKDKFPQIKLKPQYLQIAVVSVMSLMVFLGLGGGLIEILLTMVYPAMMSILALKSESDKDDRVWLNYWIIFGIITAVDPILSMIDFILPIISYQMIKIVLLVVMMWPFDYTVEADHVISMYGATIVYIKLRKPF